METTIAIGIMVGLCFLGVHQYIKLRRWKERQEKIMQRLNQKIVNFIKEEE